MNLHSKIQCIEWQPEYDLVTASGVILETLQTAVAALIKILVAGSRAAAAAMIIKILVPVAVGFTQ